MIENLDDYLIGVSFGVRFRANFSIEDQLGTIADNILYSPDSYFDSHIFPKALTQPGAKILLNDKTQDYINIDNSNFILEINFGDTFSFKKDNLPEIIINFEKQIIKGLLKEFSIKQIRRVGFVKRYIFGIETLANSFIDKTVGETLGGVNDINLNFSKKIPLQEALVKKDLLDYDNAIFNVIKRADRNEIFMSIDYQTYYDPFLPSTGMIDFKSFIIRANLFNSNKYLTWLNNNYMELTDGKE